MKKALLAIDPGKSGGWAIQYPTGETVAHKFENEADAADDLRALANYAMAYGCQIRAVLEKVHAMPGQGVTSMFTFGANYGFWRGVLLATCIPFREAAPQQWQKGLIAGKLSGPARKRALVQVAKERHPALKVTAAVADALLMLEVAQ